MTTCPVCGEPLPCASGRAAAEVLFAAGLAELSGLVDAARGGLGAAGASPGSGSPTGAVLGGTASAGQTGAASGPRPLPLFAGPVPGVPTGLGVGGAAEGSRGVGLPPGVGGVARPHGRTPLEAGLEIGPAESARPAGESVPDPLAAGTGRGSPGGRALAPSTPAAVQSVPVIVPFAAQSGTVVVPPAAAVPVIAPPTAVAAQPMPVIAPPSLPVAPSVPSVAQPTPAFASNPRPAVAQPAPSAAAPAGAAPSSAGLSAAAPSRPVSKPAEAPADVDPLLLGPPLFTQQNRPLDAPQFTPSARQSARRGVPEASAEPDRATGSGPGLGAPGQLGGGGPDAPTRAGQAGSAVDPAAEGRRVPEPVAGVAQPASQPPPAGPGPLGTPSPLGQPGASGQPGMSGGSGQAESSGEPAGLGRSGPADHLAAAGAAAWPPTQPGRSGPPAGPPQSASTHQPGKPMFGGPQSEQAVSRLPSGLTGAGAQPPVPAAPAPGQASGLVAQSGATPEQTGEAQSQSPFLPRPAATPGQPAGAPSQPAGGPGQLAGTFGQLAGASDQSAGTLGQPGGQAAGILGQPVGQPGEGQVPDRPDQADAQPGPFLRRPGQPPASPGQGPFPNRFEQSAVPQSALVPPEPAEPSGLPADSALPARSSWPPAEPGPDDDAPSGLPPRPDAG